jgi:phospholipid-binding lipoprotein MlaA
VNHSKISFLALLLLCLSGCATTARRSAPPAVRSDPQPVSSAPSAVGGDLANAPVEKVNDPLQRFNRTIFGFNDQLNNYALRPIAHGYAFVVPLKLRNGITNFFDNVQFPVRFVNSVLQGKLTRSAQEAGKFVINSTAGIGGLIKVSDHISALTGVPPEDFGQTLSFWGLPPGPYLVIPVLGPSDCRDIVGFAGDYAITPLNWHALGIIRCAYISDAASFAISGTRYLNSLPKAIETYDQIKSEAVDPYIAIRDGYLSYRAAQAKK